MKDYVSEELEKIKDKQHNINVRINQLEYKLGKKRAGENTEQEEPEQFYVCMDDDSEWKVSKKLPEWKVTKEIPEWNDGFWCIDGFGWEHNKWLSTENYDNLPFGIQPGMLCKAEKKHSGKPWDESNWYYKIPYYKITDVVECNLPIKVDRRACKYVRPSEGMPCFKHQQGKDCPLSHQYACFRAPYLPGTDIMITCKFEERKDEEKCEKPTFEDKSRYSKVYVDGVYIGSLRWAEGITVTSEELHFEEGRPKLIEQPNQPKLITLDLLKERGACREGLKWFKGYGSTYLKRLLYRHAHDRKSLDWTGWAINNLWDLA